VILTNSPTRQIRLNDKESGDPTAAAGQVREHQFVGCTPSSIITPVCCGSIFDRDNLSLSIG
jgi:hypothetical protein